MAGLLGQLPSFVLPHELETDVPKSFLNVLQELYHDGRLSSWKVRGRGDILFVRLTWFDPNHRNTSIKAKARQHLSKLTLVSCLLAELDELDDDLGYGTLPTSDSKDSGSFSFAKLAALFIEDLKSNFLHSGPSLRFGHFICHSRHKYQTRIERILDEIKTLGGETTS